MKSREISTKLRGQGMRRFMTRRGKQKHDVPNQADGQKIRSLLHRAFSVVPCCCGSYLNLEVLGGWDRNARSRRISRGLRNPRLISLRPYFVALQLELDPPVRTVPSIVLPLTRPLY